MDLRSKFTVSRTKSAYLIGLYAIAGLLDFGLFHVAAAQPQTLSSSPRATNRVDFSQFIDAVRQLGLCWLLLNESAPLGSEPWPSLFVC
jgi:hypothetical protein